MSIAPPNPFKPHLALGVTGHRMSNAALRENEAAVRQAVGSLFAMIDDMLEALGQDCGPVRFHSLLVDGVDQFTAELALERGWELVAPLPYGQQLNLAINAQPGNSADASRLMAGGRAEDRKVEAHAEAIRRITAQARLFELADRDEAITELYLAALDAPEDFEKLRDFEIQSSDQVAVAGQAMLERCDLLIAVWDGKVANLRGGTGHTVVKALEMGTPVLIMDPANPDAWSVHTRPEELAVRGGHDPARLEAVIATAIGSEAEAAEVLGSEHWPDHSNRIWAFYRRIEALFGGDPRPFRSLVQRYETPQEVAGGSGAKIVEEAASLPGVDSAHIQAISGTILPHFAWADGISAWLSDAYRSGMCFNFVLSALAVIIGAAYLPLDLSEQKWIFATVELLLLLMIVGMTVIGGRRRWHTRWFETRRVAEYLRHGPIMLLLGVFRPAGRWPRGTGMEWPEAHARHCLRSTGLPQVSLSKAYLRAALSGLLLDHVRSQRDYHRGKAVRLHNVHHRLDRLAGLSFFLAILSVSAYLMLKLGGGFGLVPVEWSSDLSKAFTFLGIAFPTIGASIAGIRFFGDFERFAAISQVTAAKLDEVETRIELLLAGPDEAITYRSTAEMAHAIDEIVIDEIENWQAVFGGKHISLPA